MEELRTDNDNELLWIRAKLALLYQLLVLAAAKRLYKTLKEGHFVFQQTFSTCLKDCTYSLARNVVI